MPQSRRPKPISEALAAWMKQEQGRHFCHCGCGQPIVIKKHHRSPYHGIPKYLHAHVRRGVPIPRTPGATNPNWKGGRIRHSAGYILIYCAGHPYAVRGYVLEHRLVLERHLRETQPESPYLIEVDGTLYLRRGVIVHHADGSKDNNDAANLFALTQGEHVTMHNHERKAQRTASK